MTVLIPIATISLILGIFVLSWSLKRISETREHPENKRPLLRLSKWLAAVIYLVVIPLAAFNYHQPIYWLWVVIGLICSGWFATVLVLSKQGKI